MEFQYEHNGEIYKVEIAKNNDEFVVKVGGQIYSLMDVLERGEGLLKFSLNRQPFKCRVATSGDQRHIFIDGSVYQLKNITGKSARAEAAARRKAGADDVAVSGRLQSPINGKIIKVYVEEGNDVGSNQDLIIIEAMKMEHRIKTPVNGKIKKIHVKEGDQVELGADLLELEPEKADEKKEEAE